jgi:hypothetical protein
VLAALSRRRSRVQVPSGPPQIRRSAACSTLAKIGNLARCPHPAHSTGQHVELFGDRFEVVVPTRRRCRGSSTPSRGRASAGRPSRSRRATRPGSPRCDAVRVGVDLPASRTSQPPGRTTTAAPHRPVNTRSSGGVVNVRYRTRRTPPSHPLTCGNGMMRQFSCRIHDQHCCDLQCRTVAGATPSGDVYGRRPPRGRAAVTVGTTAAGYG